MDAADRELLRTTVTAALRGDASSADTDVALESLGWADMLATEPTETTAIVFAGLGAAAARSGALDDVVAAALDVPVGSVVVHPAWGTTTPAGHRPGDRLRAEGVVGRRAWAAAEARVLLRSGLATIGAEALGPEPDHGDSNLARVAIDATVVDWSVRDEAAVERAVTAARWALGHQLAAIAGAMLDLARAHAVDRHQFGRPIGSFQAVRHRLAETYVAVEAAREALAGAEDHPQAVDLARVLAGRAARDAARHGQQVLAGIGFTRDHGFHRYLFAALELDGLYGSTEALTRDLGRQLLDTRTVPRLVDL